MLKGFFVTGTDTDVGKTYVSSQIIKGFSERAYKVSGFKPVASGSVWVDGKLKNEDALNLMRQAAVNLPYEVVNPYCFELAIAPHLAAEKAGVEIDILAIQAAYDEHNRGSELVIVEGAGGWKVPLNSQMGFDDVALKLGLPVILVVGLKLGCMSHALLAEEAIINKGCRIAGWVGNNVSSSFEEADENMRTLKERMQSSCIGYFEYQAMAYENGELGRINTANLLDYLVKFR